MTDLLYKYLQDSNVTKLEKQDVHLQLLSHTDYPSLKSITDTLDYFGIENLAANVPKDVLSQLPISFLGLVEGKGAQKLVQVFQTKKGIRTKDEDGKVTKHSTTSFQEAWTGTLIAIEEEEEIASKKIFKFNFIQTILIISFLLILTKVIVSGVSIGMLGYVILSLLGIGLSVLVIKEDLGYTSIITQKVCGAISQEKVGCNSVIKSDQGKLLKGITLGDLSLVYFVSVFLSITLLGISANTLYGVAILSLPIVIVSIYKQAFQLKEWCTLCLGIGVVLIVQFGILFFLNSKLEFFTIEVITLLSAGFLSLSLWLFTKPLLKKEKELSKIQTDFLKFKRDEEVFQALLDRNYVADLKQLPKEHQIRFGSIDAPVQLTAYTNPLCGYCTEAFQAYDRLRTMYPSVSIQFIFNTPEDPNNPSTRIAKRLFELYDESPNNAFDAFKNWFDTKDIEKWEERYGVSKVMLLKHDNVLKAHRELAVMNNITYTPETLIGLYKYPRSQYDYKDLLLFGDFLINQEKGKILVSTL